ncbi:prepilin-type N-terminal cleavage/methylation domain-containing protein [Candidatus Litorirhabdus singularis]|uniref:prepilin-type N-terminal cleavage/methylation domain-containing protein n=1 Tax=Candidatus Litorirhabdus singularis TaxID=2518993 RepID=UPI00242C6D47|nr:prepilin-type N-terminal cleavage/methylation domain-containing protein [Candidatus Litorirhabdus singularis]
MQSGLHRTAAFTLIEILIAMAIMSIVAMVAVPTYSGYMERIEIANVEADFVKIDMAMQGYWVSYGSYPPDLETLNLQKDDPWGSPYQYLNMALTKGNGQKRKDHNLVPLNTDYDLYSKGPDGRSVGPLTAKHSRDDIIRANNGDYVGVASDY